MRWWVVFAASLLVPLAGVSTAPAAAQSDSSAAAAELVGLINEERGRHGAPGVQSRDDVVPMAVEHSERMAAAGELVHNDEYFTDANRARLRAGVLGENVAFGPSIEAVHDALMKSDDHRRVLLDGRFGVVGIGAVWAGDRWWVTQDFVEPRP